MYDDVQYAQSRLCKTIVRNRAGYPFQVDNVYYDEDDKIMISGNNIVTREWGVAEMADFILAPIQLGYVNHNGSCVYIARIPKRHDWRQGIREENTRRHGWNNRNVKLKDMGESLYRLCMNKYPPFAVGVKLLRSDKVSSIAFTRQFALSGATKRQIKVSYKGHVIGTYNIEKDVINLNPNKKYLKERLGEHLNETGIN